MEYKCAFNMTMTADQYGCAHAAHVTRRTGPDVACMSEPAHRQCEALLERLKQAALPAFEVDDDPLTMPHSLLVKIGFGGLLGVQRLIDPAAATTVTDIHALVARAAQHFGGIDRVPCADIVEDMTNYKLARRRGR